MAIDGCMIQLTTSKVGYKMKKTFSQIGKTEPQKQTVAKDTSEGIQLIGIFGFPTAKTASVAAGYLLNTAALKSGISCLHFLL